MSVANESNSTQDGEKPQATNRLNFLNIFKFIYIISAFKPITFESRSALKRA